MRTTISLTDETHAYAHYYAQARGITLSAAINELIGKAQSPAERKPEIVFSEDGFPMFPPSGTGWIITDELVKQIEEEEFDPKNFT
jgi:hypothetical protein